MREAFPSSFRSSIGLIFHGGMYVVDSDWDVVGRIRNNSTALYTVSVTK